MGTETRPGQRPTNELSWLANDAGTSKTAGWRWSGAEWAIPELGAMRSMVLKGSECQTDTKRVGPRGTPREVWDRESEFASFFVYA